MIRPPSLANTSNSCTDAIPIVLTTTFDQESERCYNDVSCNKWSILLLVWIAKRRKEKQRIPRFMATNVLKHRKVLAPHSEEEYNVLQKRPVLVVNHPIRVRDPHIMRDIRRSNMRQIGEVLAGCSIPKFGNTMGK